MAVICGQDQRTVDRFANGKDRCAACGEELQKGNRSRVAIVNPKFVWSVTMCKDCARRFMKDVNSEKKGEE